MTLSQSQSWEVQLLTWAQEALDEKIVKSTVDVDQQILEAAYQYCSRITRAYSRTFYLASALLPQQQRKAARALYAFCRVTDNIVDDPGFHVNRKQALVDWHTDVLSDTPRLDSPVCLAWADTQTRFRIPQRYAEQLIQGVSQDLTKSRYETFEELAEYAYGVASTVGLMAMHITGYIGQEALPYAIKLGVALQLTNILRDIAEDWQSGRVYLPQEELREFGIHEAQIASEQINDNWRSLMRFQVERNRRLYSESRPGLGLLDPDGRFAITAATDLYQAILDDIERHDYDVFSRRAHVSAFGKVTRLPSIWWQSNRAPMLILNQQTM